MNLHRLFLPALLAVLCCQACQNEPKKTAPAAQPTTATGSAATQKASYICPMDCEKGKTYDQAGSCPVCKMDLALATADQLRHAATEVAAAAETTALPAADPNKRLEEEVNALHDETMREMADMERIGRQLKESLKTLQGDAVRKPYFLAVAGISRAGFDMMAWMRDYRAPANLPADEASRYLREQKTKLTRIRAAIQAATADGKKLIK